ncbi:DUF1206 domain-containing protein [Actinotalea sp. K2]|uniref:DUF1206 domain-containing protein n=1 Tax=Actinotalea sp. K2 TaxID=2939438 RepID=UPI0020178BEE|nr:DUF1206 domain-containing protein [Actinotalea sp. K2]MCL3860841.1 DUF1206 domain-containing protein [Actinotalea sp. K2]
MPEPGSISDDVQSVRQSRPVEVVARAGYVTVGILHLLIAWIALQIAFGDGSGESEDADQSGALREIAAQPAGGVMLWAAAVALTMLGLWQLAEALFGGQAGSRRAQLVAKGRAAGKGVVHLTLAVTTAGIVLGQGQDSGDEQAEEGAGILTGSVPGRVLLFAIGLGIIGFALYQVFIGITQRFQRVLRDDMHDALEPVVKKTGTVGYVARGLALVIVGLLTCVAAVADDEDEAGGMDGALTTLAQQPYGPWLLAVVAVGFAAFGLFSFGRARYGTI